MFGNMFYHELLRKYVAIFGTLFSNIYIARNDGTANVQKFKVPISYAPREKFLAMIRQKPTDAKISAITLPRMSFEITGVEYDSPRKFIRTQKMQTQTNDDTMFEPAPYDIQFQLNIMAKNTTDALRIVEQILPYFNPDWTVSAQLIDGVDRLWDLPIVRTGQEHSDVYDGDFLQRRALIWTINFELKGWLHGPTQEKKVIKFITVNTYANKNFSDARPAEFITIQPGLTANGQPTSNISQTISYFDIEEEDNWDYIIQTHDGSEANT